jgi:hypothetical protein
LLHHLFASLVFSVAK